jgi:hypothetical protein
MEEDLDEVSAAIEPPVGVEDCDAMIHSVRFDGPS